MERQGTMRTAVVFFSGDNREKIMNLSRALARGIEAQGHQADLVDGDHDINTKLTIYQYIAIGTESVSAFGGKIPEKVSSFLSSAGMVAGKRSFAYVAKSFMGSHRALARLMKSMEKEGMFLKFSDVFSSGREAEEVGKRLKIQ